MRILLKPGESLDIGFLDDQGSECDGDIQASYTSEHFVVTTTWPDDTNRQGDVYKVSWGVPDDKPVKEG